MKKTFLLSTLILIALFSKGQQRQLASSCTSSQCYKFTVKVRDVENNWKYFDVTNTLGSAYDLRLFVEDKNGKYSDQGTINKVAGGTTVSFQSYSRTSNYVLFYKRSGSDEEFPSVIKVNEIFGRKNYGYGN